MVATVLTRAAAVVVGTLVLAGWVAAQPPPVGAGTPAVQPAIDGQIRALENALAAAVGRSASAVEDQLPTGVPGLVLFAGPIQVRGFRLEGHGVFFDVEYPVLRRSIVWSMQRLGPFELNLDITLQMLRRHFPAADRPAPVPNAGPAAVGLPGSPSAPLERVGGGPPRRPAARSARGVGGGAAPSGTGRAVVDPQRVYQGALRVSLTDALLLGGVALGALLPEDAWLTVAARDVTGLGGRDGRLRVAARDLVALGAGRMALEEARERVELAGF